MKYSIIDIGSNSMRLTVYEVENGHFQILFKDKLMAGLAGYVEKGCITEAGIRRAYECLLEFKTTLSLLGITENISVFATASLRNIINTDEAAARITAESGFEIDVITGEEEALLGYIGAMHDLSFTSGTFVDIGGASAEISILADEKFLFSKSYRVGSLKLYKECVKKILPGEGSIKRIKEMIKEELPRDVLDAFAPQDVIACTGGTSRAMLKFARYLGLIADDRNGMSAADLEEIGRYLLDDPRVATDLILKITPERIHTIIPGYMILQHIVSQFEAKEIIISNYGVREGYLCQKVLNKSWHTNIPKTEK